MSHAVGLIDALLDKRIEFRVKDVLIQARADIQHLELERASLTARVEAAENEIAKNNTELGIRLSRISELENEIASLRGKKETPVETFVVNETVTVSETVAAVKGSPVEPSSA